MNKFTKWMSIVIFTFAVQVFTGCGTGGSPLKIERPDQDNNTTVSISISQALSVRVGETKTLTVTRQNTEAFTKTTNRTWL